MWTFVGFCLKHRSSNYLSIWNNLLVGLNLISRLDQVKGSALAFSLFGAALKKPNVIVFVF